MDRWIDLSNRLKRGWGLRRGSHSTEVWGGGPPKIHKFYGEGVINRGLKNYKAQLRARLSVVRVHYVFPTSIVRCFR